MNKDEQGEVDNKHLVKTSEDILLDEWNKSVVIAEDTADRDTDKNTQEGYNSENNLQV